MDEQTNQTGETDALDAADYAERLFDRTELSTDPGAELCACAVETLGNMSGGGLSLARADALQCVAVFDDLSDEIETIEHALGEGPCLTAYRSSQPALEPDLSVSRAGAWPSFGRAAVDAGIGAAFGFPLLTAGACFGALNFFRIATGALTTRQHADALVIADVSGRLVLDWQSAADAGRMAWQLERVSDHRVQVNQAVGRVSVQAKVSTADAYALLRAYAYAEARPLGDVAAEIARGVLRIA